MQRVYLDYASTTPVDPRVMDAVTPFLTEDFGNPSSPHWYGQNARKAIEDAREKIARHIGGYPDEIVFTSGATESNNLAIFGLAKAYKDRGNHLIISKCEHHCVLRPAEELESMGFEITWIGVDASGRVDPADVRKAITPKTILVAVMHASNEIGTIQPIQEIGRWAREHKIPFLVDAAQTVGHIPISVRDLNCDLLSFSGHKFYSLKGAGVLYIRKGTRISASLLGGDQERGRRASTHHVAGIVGMGRAIELCAETMQLEIASQVRMRDQLIAFVQANIAGSRLNGHPSERLPNNAHFSFEGIDGEALLMSLDMNGFCASMGSACTSGSLMPSHVLTAIGLRDDLALGSLRVSLGRSTTPEDISAFSQQLKKSIEQLRK